MSVLGPTLCVEVSASGARGGLWSARGENKADRRTHPLAQPGDPEQVIAELVELAAQYEHFERVSVGLPGVVSNNTVLRSPLGPAWQDHRLGRALEVALERLVKIASLSDVRGLGVIEGEGVELVLTLGAEFGSALFVDGRLVPNFQIGPHACRKKRTYEEFVGAGALKAVGIKPWGKRVLRVVAQLQPVLNPRLIHLRGVHAKKLKVALPEGVRVVSENPGFLGSSRLWD